jgi:tight adherence protein C
MGQTLKNLIGETRNQSKILVMQRAGKAEIQLLIPVVFLILPISVMFAIWPSYVNLVSIMG